MIDALEVPYFLGNEMSLKQINSITFDEVSNAYYALQLIGDSYYNASLDLIIYKLNPEDFSIISSNKLKTVRNTTGDLIVQKNQLVVSTNSEILFVDLNNLTITETLKTPVSESIYQGYSSYYRNGTIIRYLSRGLIEIYDAENSKLIKSFTTDYRFFFSDDGKNFINGDKLYSLINQKVEFVESLNNGAQLHYVDFIPERNEVIYGNFYSDKRSIVYNVDSGTRSYLDLATEISYINYDSSSNKVYVHQNDNSQDYPEKIIVYDFNTSTKKSLNCAETHHGRSFEFINDVIISNNGIYLDGYF